MGSAVGQVPEYIEMVVRWCKANTRMPVITKLTPNITDIRKPARAALAGGTDAVSLINTINSITARQSRQLRAGADDRRQGFAWRLLRPGGEADRHEHGGRDRPRSGNARPADLRHRRHHHLARRCRVHGARRRQRAGLHGGDDLWLQDRAGDDRRARKLDGREGPSPRSTTSSAAPRPTSPTGSISTSTTSPRRGSTRMPASNAAAATSPARTPRTRRSPHGRRRQAFRGDRGRMRRLQSLRQCLPGRELHHHGAAGGRRDGPAHRQAGVAGLRQLDARIRTTRWPRWRRSSLPGRSTRSVSSGTVVEVGAAPHPPAGTFSPYSDGEKGYCRNLAALSATADNWRKSLVRASFSPSLYGEKCPAGQ